MGASESKLVFKQGIFRLSEERNIAANDPYWTGFWELPESVEDVFSLFSPADIRRTRDAALENLETLILAVTSRLNVLKTHPSFPDPELAPERDALNCIRVLTRLLPYVYEAENLTQWEETFFWSMRRRRPRRSQIAGEVLFDDNENRESPQPENLEQEFEDAKPLGEELIDTLIDMLFFIGFTIPELPQAKSKVHYAIWQSGVGCKASIPTNKEFENNRCEILRLLLTLTSKAMYTSSQILPVQGTQALTYMATCPDKQIVLSVLCSLLNTTIKSNTSSWRLPYDHVVRKDSKQTLVVYSLQLLLAVLLYPIPEQGHGPPPKNFYRHYLGRLHRPEDFQFLADGMTRVLSQPMNATSSYLPGSQKSVKWAPEIVMLFWEVLQCNKRFRAFIIESNRAHDFVILMLYYAIEHKTDTSQQGIVKMCVFVLQTMSVESSFGKNLNKGFENQETLPPSIRLPNFRGSYADFLIISIYTLITDSKGKLDVIYPALLAIVNNMAAYIQNLSLTASSRLAHLLSSMSTPAFLLANETNHMLLQALLQSISSIIEHQYTSNANLIYAVYRAKKRVEALRQFTLEGGEEELHRAAQKRKENAIPDLSDSLSRSSTMDMLASPTRSEASSHPDASVSAEGAFAIGDSDDSDNEEAPTPSQSSQSINTSRRESTTSSRADDHVPIQLMGMSEKARGKIPAGQPTFSRQNSTTSLSNSSIYKSAGSFTPTAEWLETWLPELSLHTLLTVIKVISQNPPPSRPSASDVPSDTTGRRASSMSEYLSNIPSTASHPLISPLLASPSTIRVHLFEWSPLALGWYLSVLWGLIFSAEMTIAPSAGTAATLAGGGGAGPIGTWNGTHVKLFQVAEGKKEGPSLSAPRGAVDAVGSRIVQGVQGLSIGNIGSFGGFMRRPSGHDNPGRESVREV